MYEYQAIVDRIVDADTVKLRIDLGFSVWIVETVRIDGIDAPERFTPNGKDAIEFLKRKLPIGAKVTVRSKKAAATEKYGRYLASIEADGFDIATLLVTNGHAVEYHGGKRL